MFKKVILAAFACIVLSVSLAGAAVDGPSAWNDLAATYNFHTYPASQTATFRDAYYGDNFDADFAAILRGVAKVMASKPGTTHDDDTFNATLEDWGL
jgi:hypothetical protein